MEDIVRQDAPRQDAPRKDVLREVPLASIVSNRYQPRLGFRDEEIEELAASISEVGLLHPPLVRPIFGGDTYEIIAGERRVRACRKLGYDTISVLITTTSDHHHTAKAALIENMQRVDLNPIEIAKAMRQLLDEFGCTQEELAVKLGKKRSTVTNFLRLLQLPSLMQKAVSEQAISMAHAKVLLSCPEQKREELFLEILHKQTSVRHAENRVKEYSTAKKEKTKNQDYLKELIETLEERYGTRVEIEAIGNKGVVCIHFYSLDDLDRIVEIGRA